MGPTCSPQEEKLLESSFLLNRRGRAEQKRSLLQGALRGVRVRERWEAATISLVRTGISFQTGIYNFECRAKAEHRGRGGRRLKTEDVWGLDNGAGSVAVWEISFANYFLGTERNSSLNCWNWTNVSITAAPGTNLVRQDCVHGGLQKQTHGSSRSHRLMLTVARKAAFVLLYSWVKCIHLK